jgi:type II secretory pathway pseudopilin PulG
MTFHPRLASVLLVGAAVLMLTALPSSRAQPPQEERRQQQERREDRQQQREDRQQQRGERRQQPPAVQQPSQAPQRSKNADRRRSRESGGSPSKRLPRSPSNRHLPRRKKAVSSAATSGSVNDAQIEPTSRHNGSRRRLRRNSSLRNLHHRQRSAPPLLLQLLRPRKIAASSALRSSASDAQIEPTSRLHGNRRRPRPSNSPHSLHHRQCSGLPLHLQHRRPRKSAVSNGGRSVNSNALSSASPISKRLARNSPRRKSLLQGKPQPH